MNLQYNSKAAPGCLTVYAIIILIVSYRATASLNPLDVYSGSSIWAKIVVSILAVLIALVLFQVGSMYVLRKTLEKTTGQRAEDIICLGCNRPLLQFSGSHGMPVRCVRCGKWWHNGPACYNNVPPGTSMIHLCPQCMSELSGDQDLFDEDAFPTIK